MHKKSSACSSFVRIFLEFPVSRSSSNTCKTHQKVIQKYVCASRRIHTCTEFTYNTFLNDKHVSAYSKHTVDVPASSGYCNSPWWMICATETNVVWMQFRNCVVIRTREIKKMLPADPCKIRVCSTRAWHRRLHPTKCATAWGYITQQAIALRKES